MKPVNGKKVEEPYAVHSLPSSLRPVPNLGPIVIPPDSFFMMGDNRDNSRDSRYFGMVRRQALIGRPLFIYWSYDSGPYPKGGRTMQEWAQYYASVATHFLTRTRWTRTGAVPR
jgi:signal peptidase I